MSKRTAAKPKPTPKKRAAENQRPTEREELGAHAEAQLRKKLDDLCARNKFDEKKHPQARYYVMDQTSGERTTYGVKPVVICGPLYPKAAAKAARDLLRTIHGLDESESKTPRFAVRGLIGVL
jgi:hypothetical protein